MDLHYSLNIGMQIQKRFYSEPGILIFGGYLFCSINPKVHRNSDRITVDFFYARKPLEIRLFGCFST